MKAILLAAGLGSRLRPLTNILPKCLVPINGRPLLAYWLDLLSESGVHEVLINLHYKSEIVSRFIASLQSNLKITLVEETDLLGTGGTLLANKDFCENESFLLVHADNLSSFNLKDFISTHNLKKHLAPITMMTFKTKYPKECGIVSVDQKGIVQGFYEKVESPPGDLANGAVYICEPSVFPFLQSLKKDFIDFSTDVLPSFVGKINTFANEVYHRDIGTLTSYQEAQHDFPYEKHRKVIKLTKTIQQIESKWPPAENYL